MENIRVFFIKIDLGLLYKSKNKKPTNLLTRR